jgi:hypothetical protein
VRESSVETVRWLAAFSAQPAQSSSNPYQRLNRLLACIAALFAGLDTLWLASGHFRIDPGPYFLLALVVLPCIGGVYFYTRVRSEPVFAAMLAATAFLMVFPAACSLMSYLATTVAGPRIDANLLAIDRAFGISWPAIMAFAGDHRFLADTLGLAYQSIIPQTLLLVLLLGWTRKPDQLYGLCLAIAGGATLTLLFWIAFPSFGAYSMYHLPLATQMKLSLVEGVDYGQQLTNLLKNGPGFIEPKDLRGIIGFPSYHTVQAIVLAWYARKLPYLGWLFLALNIAVVCATPIHGGHHLIDIPGGAIVAALVIFIADRLVKKLGGKAAPAPVPAPQSLDPARA